MEKKTVWNLLQNLRDCRAWFQRFKVPIRTQHEVSIQDNRWYVRKMTNVQKQKAP